MAEDTTVPPGRKTPPEPPASAKIAVIGAGIVGNCVVGHLAELGWTDLVLIDKGPLPNPGGSTGHASNFIFPTDHNREIALLTLESQRQYAALGVNTPCGGIEVARSEERMEELRRRMTSARSWGIEAELLTPPEVVARAPFVNGEAILGGFYQPSASVVDPVRAGTIWRERARARARGAVNGLLSLTPDAQQVLGETAEVERLWSAASVWIKEGPGSARLIAEWITYGYPRLCDPHGSDVTRFYPHERTERHIRQRCREHFNKTYGIVHPREQWESARGMHRAPFHDRTAALGAEFFEAHGWERPQWYASNGDLADRYGVADRPHEWDRRWWSPIIDAEHLHLREKAGIVDLSAFQIFEASGPGVVPYIERLTVNRCDRPVGRSIYTPLLTPEGGIRADLTILRLAGDRFRIVTGVLDGARDRVWFERHLPGDGSVQFQDRSSALCTLGVWGPRAEALLARIVDIPLSQEAFRYGTGREAVIDGVQATMLRISYVGESGWEIYAPTPSGVRLWDAIREAG